MAENQIHFQRRHYLFLPFVNFFNLILDFRKRIHFCPLFTALNLGVTIADFLYSGKHALLFDNSNNLIKYETTLPVLNVNYRNLFCFWQRIINTLKGFEKHFWSLNIKALGKEQRKSINLNQLTIETYLRFLGQYKFHVIEHK